MSPEDTVKITRIALGATVLALGIAGTGTGSAAPAVNKVTGGGQITTAGMQGAGSTVAFTAQSQGAEGSAAKGQFQLQLRDGAAKETIHGTISCVVIFAATMEGMPGMAVLGGESRDGEAFRIDVTDDGQGNGSMDMLLVQRGAAALDGADDGQDTALCDQEEEAANMSLGRGNVKIHKAKG